MSELVNAAVEEANSINYDMALYIATLRRRCVQALQ